MCCGGDQQLLWQFVGNFCGIDGMRELILCRGSEIFGLTHTLEDEASFWDNRRAWHPNQRPLDAGRFMSVTNDQVV